MQRRFGLLALLALLGLVGMVGAVSGSVAPPARYVYWVNGGTTTSIGRANLDGTGVNQSFINVPSYANGVAADSNHVYWTEVIRRTIARANLDGTAVDDNFIQAANPGRVAVDAGHVYWTDSPTNKIGRANIDGSNVLLGFISGASSPQGVAVDGSHIYWANNGSGTVGRANLDGTGVNQSFISGLGALDLLAVAVDGSHVYWARSNGGPLGGIGRADLDGTHVNQNFIHTASAPYGLAVAAGHVYWTNDNNPAAIGQANLDGTGVTQSYISGATHPQAVAVTGPLLNADTTTCNGQYGGTGLKVIVPSGGTCTLLPGTRVTGNVIVSGGGILRANGVTIGGLLSTSGGTSVCRSRIGLGVTATGGSLALGGPGCAGNTITSGNVVIQFDAKSVWVWGNTIKNGHGLTVNHGKGTTDSIIRNVVSGKLLVEYSGPPVTISRNRAATASCIGNKGQTGSGNTATGKNTCPK